MTHRLKTTLITASAVMALAATSAMAQIYPTDFAALDADKNGQVSFAEYSRVVKTSGLTTTAAAQQFTRISAGDAVITEEELSLAIAFQDQPYALQNVNAGANISYTNTAPEFAPQVSEIEESPIMESEPIVAPQAPAESVPDAPSPEVDILRDPLPELTESTLASTPLEVITQPEVLDPEMPELEIAEPEMPDPEDAGDGLLEEISEPQPEG